MHRRSHQEEAMDLDQVDPGLFRRVMGRFATGVAVITTVVEGDIHGMTANAFMSASLSPPLCVVSIGKAARMHARLHAAGHYGVLFLSEEQQHLSTHFSGRRLGSVRPGFVFHGRTPVLERAVGVLTAHVLATTVATTRSSSGASGTWRRRPTNPCCSLPGTMQRSVDTSGSRRSSLLRSGEYDNSDVGRGRSRRNAGRTLSDTDFPDL